MTNRGREIDVCMMTKNSDCDLFPRVLHSVKSSDIPINRFIVVDGGSTDKTLDIIERNFQDALIVHDDGNLATSRTKAIELVETDWFAFIDSDVIISKDWYYRISRYKKYGHGLESFRWNMGDKVDSYSTTKNGEGYSPSRISSRPTTIADLIKTEYVKGINIPKDLYMFEDQFIKEYLEDQGGTWVKTGVMVKHYPDQSLVDSYYDVGRLIGKYGFSNHGELLLRAVKNTVLGNEPSKHWKKYLGFLRERIP